MGTAEHFRIQSDNERLLAPLNRNSPTFEPGRQSALLLFGPTNVERFEEAWRKRPLRFEIKRHRATRLHTDFRLELFGRLFTLAFYPQPDLDPDHEISAREQADHGIGGLGIERVVPPGYGAGPMLVWDQGTFRPLREGRGTDAVAALLALRAGRFDFRLTGQRLNGGFRLERAGADWRLRKLEDEYSTRNRLRIEDRSILTGRTLDDIVADEMRKRDSAPDSSGPSLFDDWF